MIVAAGTLHIGQKEGDDYVAAIEQVLEILAGSEIETKVSENNGQVYVQYRVHKNEDLPDIHKKMSQNFRARQIILGVLRENSKRLAQQMERGLSMHERSIKPTN
jgi:hypothetical protein